MKYTSEELAEAYRQIESKKNMLEVTLANYGGEVKDQAVRAQQAKLKEEIKAYQVACDCIVEAGKKN